MKKISIFVLCFILSTFTAYGASNVIGKVLNTDIVAYINKVPIRSYNIDGQTGIVVEDLIEYNFEVYYSDEYRTLQVRLYDSVLDKVTANYIPEKNTKKIGSFVSNVYATDIITIVDGDEVKAYNIGGKTIILIDELERYGDVKWYPNERKICFDYVPSWEIKVENDYESDKTSTISNFKLELTKNESGGFDVIGENREYLTYINFYWTKKIGKICFSFSIYMDVAEQTYEFMGNILRNMLNEDKEGNIIQDGTDFANEHMKIYINGEKVGIVFVKAGAGNGHNDYYFYLNKEIRNIEDIETIKVECE